MHYNITKTWIVSIRVQDKIFTYNYAKRYKAYNLFRKLIDVVEDKFPNTDAIRHNCVSAKDDAYYINNDLDITIGLNGKEFESEYWNEKYIERFKELLNEI